MDKITDRKTVLLVDDNIINHRILCKILTEQGYHILEAMNGQEALAMMQSKENKVNIVLLDLVMPVMDGYELMKHMNETGLIQSIPVIILTGNDEQETEIRCLEAGASDFLRKPYNAPLVQHKVASILRLWDNASLIRELETDQLTGLLNRDGFYHKAKEILNRQEEEEYMLLYLDIEGFKMINAHYGTDGGDQLLRFVADLLQRDYGNDGIVGRLGGDVFLVLHKKMELQSQKKIGEFYGEEFKHCAIKGVSIKCGIYYITDHTLDIGSMCDYAKIAQESIVQKYGEFYAVYEESMSQHAMREHQLVNYMEEALEENQFLVYLQPKHSTENGEIAGAEALVRWIHPELGFISPGEFIPLFEKNGFISKLDFFVWERVCKTLHKWQEEGLTPVPISVNASRADFTAIDLPERIDGLLEQYDIDSELLHVEVTESAYTDNPEQIIEVVSILRDMGLKIEMDDFGSGYSSLNMLSELPIDILKLDMRFMQNGNEQLKGSKRNILSFIVSLSKWLQLPTVAEGVETEDEIEVLKSMGVNLIQGYYYSKPMPVEDFKEYIIKCRDSQKRESNPPVEIMMPDVEMKSEEKPLLLVVEDIDSNKELMKRILSFNYRIETADNGQIAYEYIKEHYQELSCILLDLLMPVMDGFQLLELLHESKKLSQVPVIITTETGSNGELRALNLGAHSFVSKPYNPDVLRHHVRKAVEEKELLKIKKEYVRTVKDLSKKAYHDELTGVLNRYGLHTALERLSDEQAHTMAIVDVDRLKGINDTQGHPVGDRAIILVSEIIQKNTRQEDVVSRIGGDEFLIVLAGMSDSELIQKKMNLICSEINESTIGGSHISCSVGITKLDGDSTFEIAYKQADQALYYAKEKQKGTCVLWNSQISE